MKDPQAHGIPGINCRKLAEIREKGEPKHVVLDVRSTEEYDAGHVEDSVHVPHNELEENIESLISEKAHTVVVIIGEEPDHAREVYAHLQKKGYQDVRFLIGGFDEWCKPAAPDISDVTQTAEEKNIMEPEDDLVDEMGDIDQEDERYDPLM